MQQLQSLKLATTFSSLFFLPSTPSLSSSVPELLSTEAASSRHACSKPSPHPRSLHRTPLHRSAPTISTLRQPAPTSHKHPAICLDPGTAASLHLSYPASVKAIPPIHRHRHRTTPAHAPRPQPRKPLRHLQDPHPSRRKRRELRPTTTCPPPRPPLPSRTGSELPCRHPHPRPEESRLQLPPRSPEAAQRPPPHLPATLLPGVEAARQRIQGQELRE